MRQLSKNMTGSTSAQSSEGGFALVSMIVAIVIFSILGVALVKISSSSIFSQVGSNSSIKAYYLAEGGYRYAGSKFLHNYTSESRRDGVLGYLHDKTYTLANNVDKFKLQSYPWFFKTTSAGTSTTLATKILGDTPPDRTGTNWGIPTTGTIMVADSNGVMTSKAYTNAVVAAGTPPTVTFSGNFTGVLAETTILPVAVTSNTSSVSLANAGNLPLTSGTSTLFPPYRGTFRLPAINNKVYAYQSLSGNTLNNITEYANPAATFSISVPANTNVVLLKYLELHSTGTVGSGIMATSREVNYRGPIASISSNQGGGGGPTNVIPPDNFNGPGNPNWLPNSNDLVHGAAAIDSSNQVPGGGSALGITHKSGSNHFVMPASSLISDALKLRWSLSNGLSYDAQVKIAAHINNISYAGGMYFRRHPTGGNNTSFGLSIVYLKDYNDANTDVYADTLLSSTSADNDTNSCYNKKNSTYCILATSTPYLVLWKDTGAGPSSFKTIAYYQLPANYPVDSPYWPTLMVRIKEKPSGSSYCTGTFATSRVNEIQVYYSTNASGSGDSTAINTTILGNRRGAVNWPPDTGGTNSSNDFFRLVGWHTDYTPSTGTGPGWTSGSYQFGNPDGTNTVICTTDNLTNIAAYGTSGGPATPFPPEVALAALGNNIQQHMWFDDFAIGSGPVAGGGVSTIGFLPPVQQ